MAATSNFGSDNKGINKNSDIPSSVCHKTVCLKDWWLIKAEKDFNGRRLAIGGLAMGEQRELRVFSSSPIIKRPDLFTLETADGITVTIYGLINKSRTEENGFTPEVCSHFLIGFPYDWETYVDQCPSVSQDYEVDMVVPVESISRGGVKSSLSSETEGMDKCVSPSNDKRISKLIRQDDSNVEDGVLLIQSVHLVEEEEDLLLLAENRMIYFLD